MSDVRPRQPAGVPLAAVAALLGLDAPAGADPRLTGVSLGSQRILPGDLYAALPGARAHGASYAADAVGAGALAVLTDAAGRQQLADGIDVAVLEVADPRAVLGEVSALVYGHPCEDLTMLAVTGTQGKTTTTRLLESGLAGAGIPAAVIGTVGTRINGREVETALTTPEAPDLQGLFARMREEQVQVCAMEVSSHALVLGRVDATVFDVAAFLNLGRDHLDFHRDLDDYFAAKADLFTMRRCRLGLTNVDDEHGRRLLQIAEVPMRTFSPSGAEADWRAVEVTLRPDGAAFTVLGPDELRIETSVPLTGSFNVANALCAIALAAEGGLDPRRVAEGIAGGSGVPGRLERIDAGQDFTVVVDYAHKPDAVEAALAAMRPLTDGRVILVIGAGGDRDTGKRSLMGEIGARLADVLIVTDDNPRTEQPSAIRAAVIEGAQQVAHQDRAEVIEVGNRRSAIAQAVSLAGAGDIVVVAGKGHETGQEIEGVVHPFDDRVEVRTALEAL